LILIPIKIKESNQNKSIKSCAKKKEGIKMLSFNKQSYFPIAEACNVVPYNNELVKLQKQLLSEKSYLVKPYTNSKLLKKEAS